jgi:hypothetical protein
MHGCPKCFNSKIFNPLKKQTMGYLYKTCSERARFIKSIVKQFIDIWECEWDRNIKENTELKDFCSNTNAAKLNHKFGDGEKIKYYDFTNLNCLFKKQTLSIWCSKNIH